MTLEGTNQGRDLVRHHPKATHPSVKFDVHVNRAKIAIRKFIGECVNLAWVMQHGRQSLLDHFAERARVVSANDQDRNGDASLSQLDPFFDERYANACSTRTFKRARHGLCAMTVAICLEHGPHRHRAHRAPHDIEIVAQMIEIHLSPGWTECIEWQGSGWS
jgi:hypothetical protein